MSPLRAERLVAHCGPTVFIRPTMRARVVLLSLTVADRPRLSARRSSWRHQRAPPSAASFLSAGSVLCVLIGLVGLIGLVRSYRHLSSLIGLIVPLSGVVSVLSVHGCLAAH